jgi:hypothetical protein
MNIYTMVNTQTCMYIMFKWCQNVFVDKIEKIGALIFFHSMKIYHEMLWEKCKPWHHNLNPKKKEKKEWIWVVEKDKISSCDNGQNFTMHTSFQSTWISLQWQ